MDAVTIILSSVLIGVTAGSIGKMIGSNGKVKDITCGERRTTCNNLINEKLKSIEDKLDSVILEIRK